MVQVTLWLFRQQFLQLGLRKMMVPIEDVYVTTILNLKKCIS